MPKVAEAGEKENERTERDAVSDKRADVNNQTSTREKPLTDDTKSPITPSDTLMTPPISNAIPPGNERIEKDRPRDVFIAEAGDRTVTKDFISSPIKDDSSNAQLTSSSSESDHYHRPTAATRFNSYNALNTTGTLKKGDYLDDHPSGYARDIKKGDYLNQREFGVDGVGQSSPTKTKSLDAAVQGARRATNAAGGTLERSDTTRTGSSVVAAIRDRYSRTVGTCDSSNVLERRLINWMYFDRPVLHLHRREMFLVYRLVSPRLRQSSQVMLTRCLRHPVAVLSPRASANRAPATTITSNRMTLLRVQRYLKLDLPLASTSLPHQRHPLHRNPWTR